MALPLSPATSYQTLTMVEAECAVVKATTSYATTQTAIADAVHRHKTITHQLAAVTASDNLPRAVTAVDVITTYEETAGLPHDVIDALATVKQYITDQAKKATLTLEQTTAKIDGVTAEQNALCALDTLHHARATLRHARLNTPECTR